MKNSARCSDLKPVEPSDKWEHKELWRGVRDALMALPAHFHSDTFIEGISAIDIFTLNSALGATIENQVVETLNSIRNVWDPFGKYGTCVFVRQPQSFPDVVLKDLSDEAARPIMGIELKGWYLLAKEGESALLADRSGLCGRGSDHGRAMDAEQRYLGETAHLHAVY